MDGKHRLKPLKVKRGGTVSLSLPGRAVSSQTGGGLTQNERGQPEVDSNLSLEKPADPGNVEERLDNVCSQISSLQNGLTTIRARLEALEHQVSDQVRVDLADEVKKLEERLERLEQCVSAARDIGYGQDLEGLKLDYSDEDGEELHYGIDDLLCVLIKHRASDLHLKAGTPPTVRLDGSLVPVGSAPLTERQCRFLIFSAVPHRKRLNLNLRREIDHVYECSGVRFRINVFLERGRVSAAFRMINSVIPTIEELNLPPVVGKLAGLSHGLVLVTGPAGSGKSTTLAAMIDHINRHRKAHIITIEDPIEFNHQDINSFITQREVGTDTESFSEALRQALRQDPNVIMLGEMRDAETVMTAVTAAETGHLVLSTLHTPNAVQAIDRIVDVFQGESQRQVRLLLSTCLRAVVAQKLLNRADGKGRVPATEVMLCTPTIASHILDGQTGEIYQYIAAGKVEDMHTFTQSLSRLVEQGLITEEEAMYHADRPTEFRLKTSGHVTATKTETDDSAQAYVNYL